MKKIKPPVVAFENEEFLYSPEARTLRILSEIIEPKIRLARHKVHSTVLFFGSSRYDPKDKKSILSKYYWDAEELAFRLAGWAIKLKPQGKNFVICTGGGPGLMEAANRGAARAGGKSIGMNIELPHEQEPNHYISPELSFVFHYFFTRKFWLLNKARAIVAFPGGFGTLDELFETLTLVQTGKISKKELLIILYGEHYWREVIHFNALISAGTIAPEDIKLFRFCSTPRDAFALLKSRLGIFL